MTFEDLVPVLGSALLVIVASTRALQGPRVVAALAVLGGAVALGVGAVHVAARTLAVLPDTLPSALVRYAVGQISTARERNLVVIDGGSYPARGIHHGTLQRELAKRGYSVRVVHLGLSAGNHFERHRMYRDILARVGPRPAGAPRWTWLLELHTGYDERPFAQLEKNLDTTRAYTYLTPDVAAYGLWSIAFGGGTAGKIPRFEWTVVRHALGNAFHVGLGSLLVPEREIVERSGYIPGVRQARFRFAGVDEALRGTTASLRGVESPSWLRAVREPRLVDLVGGVSRSFVYYGLPATTAPNVMHVRRFCELTKRPCIAPDRALVEQLRSAAMWYNAGHLSSRGAGVYTRWLADRLGALRVLEK